MSGDSIFRVFFIEIWAILDRFLMGLLEIFNFDTIGSIDKIVCGHTI
jgi:hypothetical protein